MTPFVLPLHGDRGFHEGAFSLLPFLGSVLLLALLLTALAGLYLHRQGRLALPRVGGYRSPEEEAKRILAERFARGDISSEEFLERSSTLNWTPGSESLPSRPRQHRRWRS